MEKPNVKISMDKELLVEINFAKAKENLKKYVDIAIKKGLVDDEYFPNINTNLTGKTAGIADSRKNLIKLNKDLLSIESNTKEITENTVAHELAHLIVGRLYPLAKPHGSEWKRVMKVLGETPSVTHNMELPILKFTHLYACKCSEYQLSNIRHKKVQKGTKYRCTKCKSVLEEVK